MSKERGEGPRECDGIIASLSRRAMLAWERKRDFRTRPRMSKERAEGPRECE